MQPHEFDLGRDGIERCTACRITRSKSGMVIPRTAPCPALNTATFGDQYVHPVEAAVEDIMAEWQAVAG